MRNILLMILVAHGVCGASDLSSQLAILEIQLAKLGDLLSSLTHVAADQKSTSTDVSQAIQEAQQFMQEIFTQDLITGTNISVNDALDKLRDKAAARSGYGLDSLVQQYKNPQLRSAVIKQLPELDDVVQSAFDSIKDEISLKIGKEEIPQRETLSQFYSIGAYIYLQNKLFNKVPSFTSSYTHLENPLITILSEAERKRETERDQPVKLEEEKIINSISELTENITLANIDAFFVPLPGTFSLSNPSWSSLRDTDFYRAVNNITMKISAIWDVIGKTSDGTSKYKRELIFALISWYWSDVESPLGLEALSNKSQFGTLVDVYLSVINKNYQKLIGELGLNTGKIPNELKDLMRDLAQDVKDLSREEVIVKIHMLDVLEQMLSSRRIKIALNQDEDYKNLRESLRKRYREI